MPGRKRRLLTDKLGLLVTAVMHSARLYDGEVQPKRWVDERTHAWLSGNRQLSREYDQSSHHFESWLYLASIRLLGRRLAKAS